jgi:bifunctional enzyme CysN/CysC
VRENSRRHGYILSMLGIRQVMVCVNKMDLVDWREDHFRAIEREYRAFLQEIGAVSPRGFIPVSAIHGENLATRTTSMRWYDGPTLLESLDAFARLPQRPRARCACPCRPSTSSPTTATSGASSRGAWSRGASPSAIGSCSRRRTSPTTIESIEAFNPPSPLRGTRSRRAGPTGFTLAEEIYVTRGEVMSHADQPPLVSTRFRANLIWLGKRPFEKGRDYKLKLGTVRTPVHIHRIHKVIDASEAHGELQKGLRRAPRRG